LLPSSARNAGHGQERGFALLTVIVIVMALTILGLSLFSLSSFEARFFRPAVNQAQAVQSGRGGVDWARYVLESTDDLDSVRIVSLYPPGTTGVIARRGTDFDSADSTGYVFPPEGVDPEPIWVRSVASQGNQESAVLAKFSPNPGQDIYKRLMTVLDKLVVANDFTARFGNTLLTGVVRMENLRIEDYDGQVITEPLHGPPCIQSPPAGAPILPRPEADLLGDWWTEKYKSAQDVLPAGGPITLGPTGTGAAIYRTNLHELEGGPKRLWSASLEDDECILQVRGISIWLFPEGLRCTDQLRFQNVGSGDATVILVGRPGPDVNGGKENDVGIALFGGVDIPTGVNVFMISNGCVEIEHEPGEWEDKPSKSKYLSIYADWVKLKGPIDPEDMTLEHGTGCNPSMLQDDKDHLVDQLIEANLLPNSRFARRKLAFVPGTWNENPTPVGN
jgi:hypothetical protein